MPTFLFLMSLSMFIIVLFYWGFRNLQHERFQFLFSVPKTKTHSGQWEATNYTFYGFFNASASVFATAFVFMLLAAMGFSRNSIVVFGVCVLGLCVPSAKLIARLVEKKSNTLSIGGASFLGIVIAPWIVYLLNPLLNDWFGMVFDPMCALSATAIGYTLGESIGRLACVSFGCCYGRKIDQAPKFLAFLFQRWHFAFTGHTKKAAYADGFEGCKVIPIQAMTAILYAVVGVVTTYLFFKGYFATAFLIAISITQIWRFLSEFLRADYRGEGKISAYQIMGIVAVIYSVVIALIFPTHMQVNADIVMGIKIFWDPAMVIFLQVLWIGLFLFTGTSKVTSATLSFHVNHSKI